MYTFLHVKILWVAMFCQFLREKFSYKFKSIKILVLKQFCLTAQKQTKALGLLPRITRQQGQKELGFYVGFPYPGWDSYLSI